MAFGPTRPRVTTEGVASRLREALHRVLGGDLPGAESVLAQAVRLDSSSSDLYLALAELYRARGEIGRAIQIHQNLLLRQELPEDLRRDALLGLALDFRTGGFLKRAAAAFGELLEHEPRNLAALRALERIHVDSGEWVEAIALRRRIGSDDPRTPRIRAHLWTGLMRDQMKADRLGEAQRSFRRAVASDRRCAEPYQVFGDLRVREGRFRKAISLYRRALQLMPEAGVLVYPRLLEAHERESDLEGFCALLAEHRRDSPRDREATLWWARASLQMGRTEVAIQALRSVIHESPSYLPAYAEMGRALLRAGRDDESVKAFEELLTQLAPASTQLRCRECGTRDSTLHWRCPQCGEWDSFA